MRAGSRFWSFFRLSFWMPFCVLGAAGLPAGGQDLFTRVTAGGAGERVAGPLVRFDVEAMRAAAEGGPGAGAGNPDRSFALSGFPLRGDVAVDLRLRALPLVSERTRFLLGTPDGPEPYPFDPSSVALFTGDVPGYAGSHVFLAFGRTMSVGRVELGPGRASYTISAPSGGLESAAELAVTRARAVNGPMGMLRAWCGVEDGAGAGEVDADAGGARPGPGESAWGPTPVRGMRQIEQRVVSDHELFLLFGDEMETFEYLLLVYGAASDIMMRDLRARLDLVEVIVWAEPDPWGPGSPILPNTPGADITQLLSGTRFTAAGGSAFLCGTSSELHGALGFFGGTVNPLVHSHDIRVVAHEIGHNLGAGHTHGIDRCDRPTTTPRRGTIMSYCSQMFSGGDGNTDPWFHVASRSAIAGCMSHFRSSGGATPILAPDCNQNGIFDEDDIAMGVSADLNVNGIPDECEDCNGNTILDDEDIASGTSLDLNGNGVPDECEPDCNGNMIPDDMDVLPQPGPTLFYDGFEDDLGWTIENLGATDGDWERAVPVNDPNWTWAPAMDSDGSGRCMVTDNAPGESDVDAGATRVTSPLIDMSGGADHLVLFDYFLGLSQSSSSDFLFVEAEDGSGQWRLLASLNGSTAPEWRTHTVDMRNFGSLNQTASMRFRFTIDDDIPESTVEGAIDAFRVIRLVIAGFDENGNGVLDSCEADCNTNGVSDHLEIIADMTLDINRNAVLDECENCDGDEFTDFEEIDGAGNLWAAVPGEDIIREYHGITGVLVRDSDAGALLRPSDVLITADARVLVSSTGDDRIVEFDRRGALVGDLVAMGAGGLSEPGAMALSPRGTLMVASTGSDEVLEYDVNSGAFLGTFVTAGSGGLVGPYGLAFLPGGNLLVTSTANEILEYDGDTGALVRVFATGVEPTVRDILVLPDGKVLAAAQTNELHAFDGATGDPLGEWSNGTFGGRLQEPWGLAIGPSGDLYVSASGRGESHLLDPRVHRYNADTGTLIYPFVHGLDSRLNFPRGIDFLPAAGDCNLNLYPDECDILHGLSQDANGNGVPDECETCYADCDQSTGPLTLDIFDFLCFQDAFVSGDPYADCDGNGRFDIFDFLCFQDAFAVGCS